MCLNFEPCHIFLFLLKDQQKVVHKWEFAVLIFN